MKYKNEIFSPFFAAMVVFNLAANFAHPVTPTVIQELRLHDYMFGVALAVMLITNFLLSPFWGKINNYISSRLSLLICCLGYGVAQIWFAYATTELMIILARMFAGLFTGGIFVSFLTYIVNKVKPGRPGKISDLQRDDQECGQCVRLYDWRLLRRVFRSAGIPGAGGNPDRGRSCVLYDLRAGQYRKFKGYSGKTAHERGKSVPGVHRQQNFYVHGRLCSCSRSISLSTSEIPVLTRLSTIT